MILKFAKREMIFVQPFYKKKKSNLKYSKEEEKIGCTFIYVS